MRPVRGWTQQPLAAALCTSAPLVCRDERNGYRNIATARAQRILDAFGAQIGVRIEGLTPTEHLPAASPLDEIRRNPGATGGWRKEAVWIGGTGLGPHQADFVPPRADLVPAAMADLVEFMKRDDLPVLAHAVIAHAQFETIHPFVDGNGRTGRALLHSMLRSKGLLRTLTVPISAGLLADTKSYFASLSTYQRGNPENVALLVSEEAFRGAAEAHWLMSEVEALLEAWRGQLTSRQDALSRKVLEELPKQPVLSVGAVESRFEASNTAARRALEQLEDAGIVREFTNRRRSRLWVAEQITDLLDQFAQRAPRRRL